MNLIEAIDDAHLFARWFRDRETWTAWRAFLAALFGHRLTADQAAIFRACTRREALPADAFGEAWLVCGRRAGKSFILALIAVYLATFRDHRMHLAPGERATILVIATDRRQARTILRYVRALLLEVPMLARLVERDWSEGFDLTNRVTIEVGTASFRRVRGYTVAAALCDEIAFWPSDDAAEPDYAILDALRPAMATIPGAMLLCASSPHSRRGALYDAWKRYFGRGDPRVLVWQAPTRTMNPTVPEHVVAEAMERDEAVALAEFGAVFRSDLEAFVAREVVLACVSPGVFERPRVPGVRYSAFVDPSGGSNDSFTLAISHREGETAVVDAVRERKPPFSPEAVVADFAGVVKAYGVHEVHGDRYAGEWPREAFRKQGVAYRVADKVRTDLYRDLLPALNSGRVDLLESDRLVNQLTSLERRAARSGRETIDHPPNGHDDVANAVAGAASLAAKPRSVTRISELIL